MFSIFLRTYAPVVPGGIHAMLLLQGLPVRCWAGLWLYGYGHVDLTYLGTSASLLIFGTDGRTDG